MATARTLEGGKFRDAARFELQELKERAAKIEAQLNKDSTLEHDETLHRSAERAVGDKWREVAHVPSPGVVSRVDSHPQAITLQLAPEAHDEKMGEIIYVLQKNGVTKAIKFAEDTANPHLIDDFHRVLVEWVREGLPISERRVAFTCGYIGRERSGKRKTGA